MKTVIATIIEKNEYRIKIDVENDATEDEICDAVEEVYWKDDYNNMAKVDSNYNIKIKNSRWIDYAINRCRCLKGKISRMY